MDSNKRPQNRRIISKILSFNENNQYEFAMIKPLPTGCINENTLPPWLQFNLLLECVNLDDKIGHLFVVDIEFDEKTSITGKFLSSNN